MESRRDLPQAWFLSSGWRFCSKSLGESFRQALPVFAIGNQLGFLGIRQIAAQDQDSRTLLRGQDWRKPYPLHSVVQSADGRNKRLLAPKCIAQAFGPACLAQAFGVVDTI